jgi:hypothetical protein
MSDRFWVALGLGVFLKVLLFRGLLTSSSPSRRLPLHLDLEFSDHSSGTWLTPIRRNELHCLAEKIDV